MADNKYCSTCFKTGEELDEALQKAMACDGNAARAEAAAKRAEEAASCSPDWNQNDSTGAGYIKNRPFYDDAVIILPETTLVYEDDGFFCQDIYGEFDITPGKTYTVKWNGVEYECVAEDIDGDIYFEGIPVADITYYTQTSDLELFAQEAGTVKVSIYRAGDLVKLPDKYLDMTAEEWTFELEDGTTVTKQVMVK